MLLIDVGNSRLKWCFYESVQAASECSSHDYLKDNVASLLVNVLGDVKPQSVWISCVAGESLEKQLTSWFLKYWKITPVFAQTQASSMGLTNAYQKVSNLGVDRWLAMLAAWRLYRQAVCVIDCGTAITLDVVNATGEHQGGLILPGQRLLQQSLQVETSAIEQVTETDMLLANDTADAVGAGCRLMVSKSIPSIVKEFERHFDIEFLCVLTGGDSHLLMPEFKCYEQREDLVLFGLYLMASQ